MSLRAFMPWMQEPPVLRRLSRNYIVASSFVVLLAIAIVICSRTIGVPHKPWSRFGPLFFGAMPLLVFAPIHWALRHRVARQFKDADGRLCAHCAYNVGPLGSQGTCPECGKPFDAVADGHTWGRAMFRR